jgi:hypothetical protein
MNRFIFFILFSFSILWGCTSRVAKAPEKGFLQKRVLPVSTFSKLEIEGNFDVYLKQGTRHEVILASETNKVPYFSWEKDSETLKLKYSLFSYLSPSDFIVLITAPGLSLIELDGSIKLHTVGKFSASKLHLDLDGRTTADLFIDGELLSCDLDGMAQLTLKGQSKKLNATLDGKTKLKAEDFQVGNAHISTDGISIAQIHVNDSLVVQSDGISRVEYRGNPSYKSINKESASRIIEKKIKINQ